MQILVTGGAGFIGSHLCEKLLEDHHQVYCVDNFCDFYAPSVKEQNIQKALLYPNFTLIKADITEYKELENVFLKRKIDLVIHLAAMAGVRPSITNPQLYFHVNIMGTANLLELCQIYGVKKFIFASSSSVYGNNEKIPFSEDDNVDFPISPYAASKKACELICHSYHKIHAMSIICLRLFTVYGPRQRPDLAIHDFTEKILQDKEITLFGNGGSQRDYTFIDDILGGFLQSIDYIFLGKKFQIFNLGEAQTISLLQMVETIEKVLQKKAKKKFAPMQLGDVERTYADISKSKKILNYNPKIDFETGIKKFIDWKKNS